MSVRKVAQHAGVSISTVSLVMSGGKKVSDEKRERVLEAVRELNYKPGKAGRPCKAPGAPKSIKLSHRLAMVTWRVPRAFLNSPIYMSVIRGVEKRAIEARKAVVLRNIMEEDEVGPGFLPISVDGFVFLGEPTADELQFFQNKACVRVMGAVKPGETTPYDRITYNGQRVGALAAQYLAERQHRCVATFKPSEAVAQSFTRLDVFLQQARKVGLKTCILPHKKPLLIREGDLERGDSVAFRQLVKQWAAMKVRPTGIFTHSDVLAQSLHPALIREGFIPGKDVEIISCNNDAILLNGLEPRPATIDIHADEIGMRAVDQLLMRIEKPDTARFSLELDPTLIPGT